MRPAHDLLEMIGGVERKLGADHLGTSVKLQIKTGDDAKKSRTRAARGPIYLGIFACASVAQFPLGVDIVDRQHALAGHSCCARVPAEAALEKKAAEANALAMADRKEQLLRGQQI